MRKSAVVLGLVAALSGGAALANSVNPGVAQLAAQAGVNAANLSAADVAAEWAFKHDTDAAASYEPGYVSGALSSSNAGAVNAGVAQLAAQAGVNAANLSAADVAAEWAFKRDNDAAADYDARFVSGAVSAKDAGLITPARAQLAAQLGLNPADYSFAELAGIKAGLNTDTVGN